MSCQATVLVVYQGLGGVASSQNSPVLGQFLMMVPERLYDVLVHANWVTMTGTWPRSAGSPTIPWEALDQYDYYILLNRRPYELRRKGYATTRAKGFRTSSEQNPQVERPSCLRK